MKASSSEPGALRDPIRERIGEAPTSPGVYWLRDARGRIIYVGKGVNVRARLRSHLNPTGRSRQKIHRNWARVKEVQWMATATEDEALALEESLIREHRPRCNVALPHYGFLCLTMSEPYPRFLIAREMTPRDGNLYFGPYPDRRAMERLFTALLPLFRIRGGVSRCSWDGQKPMSPCHRFEIGWCSAPCAGQIDAEAYGADAGALAGLLTGSQDLLQQELAAATGQRLAGAEEECRQIRARMDTIRNAMREAAENLQFEDAARMRDEWTALDRRHLGELARIARLRKQQSGLRRAAETTQVVQSALDDLDVWAVAHDTDRLALVVLPFRSGRACAGMSASGAAEDLVRATRRFYSRQPALPALILYTGAARLDRVPSAGRAGLEAMVNRLALELRSEKRGMDAPEICPAEANPAWAGARDLARLNALAALSAPSSRCHSSAGA